MIASRQNPLVKQLCKLHTAKQRHQQQLFLVEGTHLVEAACQAERQFVILCSTSAWQERHPQLWEQALARTERWETVTPAVLAAIATTVQPDGIVGAIARPASPRTPDPTTLSLGLAVERLQDPGNLGTLIRTAVATGVEQLWLSGDSVDPDHPKVLRASAGAWFRQPLTVSAELGATLQVYRDRGIQVVATVPRADEDFWAVDWQPPSILLLGNEGAGLSAAVLACADRQVKIPLQPGVESLNVAIAAALLLYEVSRQRRRT
ncbi:MAG: RNA methyltransferase [Spirulinaceae cyanobacterium SM2_1_0]|nr:RNA methyltransferase [Spirulinaceae cyanobacterium SM2_1_0]